MLKPIINKIILSLKKNYNLTFREVYLIIEYLINKNLNIYLYRNINLLLFKRKNLEKIISLKNNNESIYYIYGFTKFVGNIFIITPEVMIPRKETEIIVYLLINELRKKKKYLKNKILDLGTGSGVIPVSICFFFNKIKITASDINSSSLDVAKVNFKINKIYNEINFLNSDIYSKIKNCNFDIILSNPPYIHRNYSKLYHENLYFETYKSLTDNFDGLSIIRKIIIGSIGKLKKYGLLYIEHSLEQTKHIEKILYNLFFYKFFFKKNFNYKNYITCAKLLI